MLGSQDFLSGVGLSTDPGAGPRLDPVKSWKWPLRAVPTVEARTNGPEPLKLKDPAVEMSLLAEKRGTGSQIITSPMAACSVSYGFYFLCGPVTHLVPWYQTYYICNYYMQ